MSSPAKLAMPPSEASPTPASEQAGHAGQARPGLLLGPPPFLALFVGAKASGKSYAISYICKSYADQFAFIVVFSPTSINGFYDFLPSRYVHNDYDPDVMQKIIAQQEKYKKAGKNVQVLIIMDDILGSDTIDFEKRKSNELSKLWAANRHWDLSIIVVTQSLKKIPKLLRLNVDYALLFRCMREAYAGLYETFGHMDRRDFFEFLEQNTMNYKTILYKAAVANSTDHFRVFTIPPEAMDRKFKLVY